MITIFCDFHEFSAKKISVRLKNQCYDPIFAKNSSSVSKNRQNIFKNYNIGPGSEGRYQFMQM
jgi:hypothetical protein